MTERASRRAAETPTGTVTFLFTDIEGSTAMHENYPDLMYAALKRHDDILRHGIEANGGYVFNTGGDAFCAAFTTARQALQAALAAQRALYSEGWPENVEVRVRMGLHTGVPEERDGNYFGPPLNRVARLMSAGHGGQVLLSDATYNLVRDHLVHLEPGSELRDLGEHRLRDLRYTEHIFQLVVPDLPEGFEPLKTHGLVTPSEITDLDRRYGRARHIGGGGFGEVYLVHHEALDRDMALKVLARQYANDEQFVKLFKREARSAAKLSHPNIVAVYDAGEGIFEGRKVSYIAMEYVPGGTLKDLIRGQGEPLPLRMAVELALQVAGALRAAHRGGVIHRDIKPQNVLLTEEGEAKVADFGIARAVAASTTFTRKTDGMLGTPHYISPEQVLGEPASFRSDLYSLGVVLYEMLTGRLPFDAETPVGIVMKHVNGHLRSPKEVNPDIPEGLNATCVRLLAKDPEERYPDADTLIDDLERVRDDLDAVVNDEGSTTADLGGVKDDTVPKTVEVPDLAGQELPEVGSTLAEANLELGDQDEAPSETVPEGVIVEQDPPAGTEVEAESSVSVTVSTGPSTVEVPDIAGQNLARVCGKLAAAGLKLGGKDEAPSDTVTKGAIIQQEPAAGTKAERGSSVSITISTGPREKETIPDLSARQSTTEAGRVEPSPSGTQEVRDEPLPHSPPEQGERSAPTPTTPPDSSPTHDDRDGGKQRWGWPLWAALAGLLVGVVMLVVVGIALQGGFGGGPPPEEFTLASTLSGHSSEVQSVAFNPDGNLLASGSETIKLWDPQTGEEIRTVNGSGPDKSVAFSPDGSLLASGSGNSPRGSTVKLWNPRSGEDLRTLSGIPGNVTSVAFSPDGRLLAIGNGTTIESVMLWDPRSGEQPRILSGHSGIATKVVFSPDGSLLASGSADNSVKLWDLQSGEKPQSLRGHSGNHPSSVAFSPDGSLLASGGADDTVTLWDPQSGEELQTLSGHSDGVTSVAFSPDGRLLGSGSRDGTVKLWDLQSREELQTLSGHSGAVTSVAFSPDGRLLASGGGKDDGTVRIWERVEDEQ